MQTSYTDWWVLYITIVDYNTVYALKTHISCAFVAICCLMQHYSIAESSYWSFLQYYCAALRNCLSLYLVLLTVISVRFFEDLLDKSHPANPNYVMIILTIYNFNVFKYFGSLSDAKIVGALSGSKHFYTCIMSSLITERHSSDIINIKEDDNSPRRHF